MDRIGDLSLFLRVLDLGSISAAARSLDLSVAVASQRLKRLERELGVRLLHRTTRQLHATPEGMQLAEQGRALVEDLESLTGGLRQSATEVSGTLRVTMSAAFGSQYVSPLLPEFLGLHPRVKLSVNLDDQIVDLVGSGFDLGIRVGEMGDSSLVARRLASNRRVLCASPAYLQRHGEPRTPAELAGHRCIVIGDQRRTDWKFDGGETTPVRVDAAFLTNDGGAAQQLALAGSGIALKSIWDVGDDLASGRLRRVLPDHAMAAAPLHAVYPHQRNLAPRVRLFVEYLKERLQEAWRW